MDQEAEIVEEDGDYLIVDFQKENQNIEQDISTSVSVIEISEATSFEEIEQPSLSLEKNENGGRRIVEIERKFVIPDNCEQTILNLRGHLEKQECFTDHYYDTREYELTLKDRWLRNRSGKWQMKYPTEEKSTDRISTQYYETDNEQEILNLLNEMLSRTLQSVQDFVRSECHPIAVITTHRTIYTVGKVHICLDCTDYGFRVGEIELIIKDGDNFSEGLQLIDDIASKLGFISFATFDISTITRGGCV